MSAEATGGELRAIDTTPIPEVDADATLQSNNLASITRILDTLRGLSDVVCEIASSLEVGLEWIAAWESLTSIELTKEVPFEIALSWDEYRVAQWFSLFGSDLSLTLRMVGLSNSCDTLTLDLNANMDQAAALRGFLSATELAVADQGNDVDVSVRLRITKVHAKQLVLELLNCRPGYLGSDQAISRTHVFVFYCMKAWTRLLSIRSLWKWESDGIVSKGSRTFVALCDVDGYFAGKVLEILGVRLHEDIHWLPLTRASWKRFVDRAQRIRRLQQNESYWDSAPRTLTPEYLHVQERNHGPADIQLHLTGLRAALSAAFLASTVLGDVQDGLILRFAGVRPCTTILPTSSSSTELAYTASPTAIIDLARWAYQRGSVDRLIIARECLSEKLPKGEETSISELGDAAFDALEDSKANFVLYVRHNTKLYFQQRQQAMEATYSHAEAIRKSVSTLTSDLVSNVYATGALLVGAVVAQVLSPSSSGTFQWLACAAYDLYVLFILFYVMPLRWHQFDRESESLTARIHAMPELESLDRVRINEIAAPDETDFKKYFWKTMCIYVSMIALVSIYMLIIVSHLPIATQALPTVHPTPVAK